MPTPDNRPQSGLNTFLALGFRPFFALAGGFAILSMLAWAWIFVAGRQLPAMGLPASMWHAHEMTFGYAPAVVAGFLLTAVRNWTGIRTLHGPPLLLLLLLWLAGRVLLFTGTDAALPVAPLAYCVFMAWLCGSLLVPVMHARQWKQLGILSKLLLLLLANAVFYAGALGLVADGMRIGLYSGVYLVIALIFVMGRRVMPFFIEKGVSYPVQLVNRRWLDRVSLLLFLAFWIADIARPDSLPVAVLAAALTILHVVRLAGWHTPGIWRVPLLWVLWLGYAWLITGFALKALAGLTGVAPTLALHAFTYGGIGMITLGMMVRVTLGHTGRNVSEPPPVVSRMFAVLCAGAVVRVLLPLLDPAHYLAWIGIAQMLWIIAFTVFLATCLPMLVRPRSDGLAG